MVFEAIEIEGYEAFVSKITELEADESKHPLFVLFTGSDGPDGKSWCPDCIDFEGMWEKLKPSLTLEGGTLVRVKVGPRDFWKDKNCPFRIDKKTKLSSIPTLVRWGTAQRLSDNDIQKPGNVQMLMEED